MKKQKFNNIKIVDIIKLIINKNKLLLLNLCLFVYFDRR